MRRKLAHALGILVCLGMLLSTETALAGSQPGDEFRQAAAEYERESQDAIEHAARAEGADVGRYMQLAALNREMAAIKHRAAALADAERWDEVTWDDYYDLQRRRDEIFSELNGETEQSAHLAGHNTGFRDAANEYREQARDANRNAARSHGIEQVIFEELAVVLEDMAAIKDEAAEHAQGGDYDWSHYEQLSERRQKLENMLDAAR